MGKSRSENHTDEVDTFMEQLDHPFKAEAQAVRKIIKSVNTNITEQVKWNAPSFSYKGYMATFSLHRKQHLLLIFHNGAVLNDQNGLLQGSYPDRRMVYFDSMEEVRVKEAALVRALQEWIERMDNNPEA